MDEQTAGQVYSGPQQVTPTAVGPRPRRVMLIVATLAVILLAVATGYFLFIRNIQSPSATKSETSPERVEYANSNGFSFSYPENLTLSETAEGAVLTGEQELSFVIKELTQSLRSTVGNNEEPETFTADARVGYKIARDGTEYYYFPLFGDKYLEIVSKGANEEILSSLKFVAPQNASVN